MNYRCYQITLRVKHFYTNWELCEVLTGCLSLGRRPVRWLGEYVTLDKKFYNLLFKQEVVTPPAIPTFSFLLVFIRNIIIILCNNYTITIFINNAIINNNLWKNPRPYFALQNFHGHANNFFEISSRAFKNFRPHWSKVSENTPTQV